MSAALAYAAGIALSPLPVVVALVLLSGTRPRRASLAFLAGTAAATAVAVSVLVAAVSVLDVTDASGAADGARVALGLFLVALGVSFSVGRRRLRTVHLLDRAAVAPPPRAAAIGLVLPLVNPKNLSLMLAAAIAVASGGAPVAGAAVVALISVSVVAAVTVLGLTVPGAAGTLGAARRRISFLEVEIGIAVCLILGAKLLAEGL